MKKFRGILSIIMVLVLLCSCFTFAGTASATTVATAETSANIPDNIQDGLILHAFCWGYSEIEENLDAIAAAGYTAIQTSPVQQPKDMNTSTDIPGQWWKLYQPASLSIGDNTWLGTKEELTSLCAAAKEKGIKIICDVVTNHLGASSDLGVYALAKEVATYEPTLWNSTGGIEGNPYFHQVWGATSDASVNSITQGWLSECPDLNSGNDYVQQSVLDLLKECIDCGVSGFRFDAAKHIETTDDGDSASDYWPTVLGGAKSYASSKGIDLFYYGEILNSPGSGRSYSSYTKEGLSITDNKASAQIRAGITGHNAPGAAVGDYNVGEASDAVLWAESHDTFLGTSEDTGNVSNEDIVKTWAIVASRKDATALFFPRTDSMAMGGSAVDTTYKSVAVSEVNKFHNECVGESETLGSYGNFAYVVRGNKGMVIVNTNGTKATASISGISLADGTYTDMITGNEFTVSGGTVKGSIGSTGVAVVTKGETTPTASADKESQAFEGDTITLKLSLNNAVSGTYQLDDYETYEFTGSPTIRIGSDYNVGDTIKLTLTATDGTNTTTTTYKYTKKQAATSGVYVMISADVVNSKSWTAPLYCYIYDEDTDAATSSVYQNAAWPGEAMKYDENLECYYVQVQNNSCIMANKTTGETSTSTFNLAASGNTNVIFSDSAAVNGSAHQHPAATSTIKLALNNKTHLLNAMSNFNTNGWVESTDVPGNSTIPATEVGKDGAQITLYTIGDINLDNTVDINDVTAIQKYLVKDGKIVSDMTIADVDDNGRVNIFDATYIQRYLVGMSNCANVGQKAEPTGDDLVSAVDPIIPETTAPATEPTPDGYTAYVKTTLTWITDMGCNLYLYDKTSSNSYLMTKDESAYPNVYVTEVPLSCSDVIFYRALSPVADPANDSSAYNLQKATISQTNNCYTWEESGGKVGPYVSESAPTFSLSRLYVDNSEAKWSEVYIYGWGAGLNSTTYALTNISGTDIWYYDLPEPISDGIATFLLKNTAGSGNGDWDKQSANVKITSPYNCYKISSTNKGEGTWSTYQ